VGVLALALICVLTFVLALVNVWLGPGIVHTHAGGDSPFLMQRVYELAANLKAGVFPARWMPDAAFGLGYPFFNFYASFPYYLAAGLNLAGFDLLTAIKLTQTIGMVAAAATMYLFARTLLPRPGAALAAMAYTLAPYHLVNIYVRGDSLVEFFAFVWYPLILWGVDRVIDGGWKTEDGSRSHAFLRCVGAMLLLATLVAARVVTHNVSTLLFAPFIVLYALLRLAQAWRQDSKPLRRVSERLLWLAGAAVLAVALSAWFWLPALGEAGSVQLGEQTTGYFHYSNHFRGWNLIQPSLVFDYSVDPSLNAFAMALPQAILILLGAAVWWWRTRRGRSVSRGNVLILLALFVLSTFVMTPLSQFVWDATPLLPLAQFPWRLLSVQALFGAVLIGGLFAEQADTPAQTNTQAQVSTLTQGPTFSDVGSAVVFVLASIALLLALPGMPNERLDMRAEDVTPQTLQLYEWFSGNIGTTIRAEYLPQWVQPRPAAGPDLLQQPRRALAVEGVVETAQLEHLEPARQVWRIVVASEQATLTLPLLYWPGWQAAREELSPPLQGGMERGGEAVAVDLSPYTGSGWTMLRLPQGEHRVTLWLAGTTLERTGEALSLVALGLWGVLGLFALARVPWRRIGIVAASALLAVIAVVLIAQVSHLFNTSEAPALQWVDYQDRQFPHRAPMLFRGEDGQQYELTGATLEPAQARAGKPFTLRTTWRDGRAPAQVGLQQELPSGGHFAYLFRFARETSWGEPALSQHTVLSNALPGPLLLKLMARDEAGRVLTPTTAAGRVLDQAFLTGFTVADVASADTSGVDDSVIRTFPNGIVLHKLDWYHPTDHDICFRATWGSVRPLAAALQVSFVLRGEDGREIARADTQPQAGLAPTWSWPQDTPVQDSVCAPTTALTAQQLQAGEPYTLLVRWYRLLDQHATGEVTLVGERASDLLNAPNVPRSVLTEHRYDAPPIQQRTDTTFAVPVSTSDSTGGDIRLLGYDLLTSSEVLSLTLYWSATATVTQDYKSFVHLASLSTPDPVRQADRFTRDGMYPTGMWLPGEVVSDTVVLDLRDVPAGAYQLAVGWYDPDTLVRLPARVSGIPVADGRVVLETIQAGR
jgi:hypothetical protein